MIVRSFGVVSSIVGLLTVHPPTFAGTTSFDAAGGRMTRQVRSLHEIRQQGVVRQRWDLSCGSAALSTILTYYYDDPTPESAIIVNILRRTDPVKVRTRGGFSLLDLKQFAGRKGYEGAGYADLSLTELLEKAPGLVPVNVKGYQHFVVVWGMEGGRLLIADPAFGNLTMRRQQFLRIWQNGIGFFVVPRGGTLEDGERVTTLRQLPVPDLGHVRRSLRGAGPAAATRRGP